MDGAAVGATNSPLLHCFGHAGGTPASFRRWSKAFSPARVVVAPPVPEPRSIVDLAARWRTVTPDRSGVYYGHSLGALVAFEAAAAAFAEGDPTQVPSALVLGAPPAPGRGLVTRVGPPVRRDNELAPLLGLIRRYRPSSLRLPTPVLVLHGELDDIVHEDEAHGWVARGGAGSRWVPVESAGHFFHLIPTPPWVTPVRDLLTPPRKVRPA